MEFIENMCLFNMTMNYDIVTYTRIKQVFYKDQRGINKMYHNQAFKVSNVHSLISKINGDCLTQIR